MQLDGKLYLAGGFVTSAEGHFEPADSIEVYDPASNGWTTLMESSPVPLEHVRMMSVQGRLLLVAMDREGSGSCQLAWWRRESEPGLPPGRESIGRCEVPC